MPGQARCLLFARVFQGRAHFKADRPGKLLFTSFILFKNSHNCGAALGRGGGDWTRRLRIALAGRAGPIVPLETRSVAPERYVIERHLCIDTTAAGGNARLLAASA